jgi:hypothetical protein
MLAASVAVFRHAPNVSRSQDFGVAQAWHRACLRHPFSVRTNAVNPKTEEEVMKTIGGLAIEPKRANAIKGGIIIIGGVPQLRPATLDPLTIRGLNPQPLPPRL